MRLSDVIGGAGLAGYAEVALLLFLAAFLAIVLWLFWPGRRQRLERRKQLPFESGEDANHREGDHR